VKRSLKLRKIENIKKMWSMIGKKEEKVKKKEGKWKVNNKTKGSEGLTCDEDTELTRVF